MAGRDKQPAPVADDAEAFADLELDPSESVAEAQWLYQLSEVVFGPVDVRGLLELLYAGTIDADTLVATEDGEFMALRRFGAFRGHLERAKSAQLARASAQAEARRVRAEAQRSRLRWALVAVATTLLASGTIYGIVRWQRSVALQGEAARDQERIEAEIERLLAEVTIEPPLMPLVSEPSVPSSPSSPGAGSAKSRERRRSRRTDRKRTRVAGPLSQQEVMGGLQSAFPGFVRCIKGQLRRDPNSVPDTVVLRFSIGNQGRARDLKLKDRFLRVSPLHGCVVDVLAKVSWRAFEGEVRNVEYPIRITRPASR